MKRTGLPTRPDPFNYSRMCRKQLLYRYSPLAEDEKHCDERRHVFGFYLRIKIHTQKKQKLRRNWYWTCKFNINWHAQNTLKLRSRATGSLILFRVVYSALGTQFHHRITDEGILFTNLVRLGWFTFFDIVSVDTTRRVLFLICLPLTSVGSLLNYCADSNSFPTVWFWRSLSLSTRFDWDTKRVRRVNGVALVVRMQSHFSPPCFM